MAKLHQKDRQNYYAEAIKQDNIGWEFNYSIKFIIVDESQNRYITNFDDENPGSTYYFSPSNMYQFGIFNAPPVVTLYIIVSISRMQVQRGKKVV